VAEDGGFYIVGTANLDNTEPATAGTST